MGYSSAQAKEFIEKVAPIVQKYAQKYGYKTCSAVIAQAIIEGAAGTSSLAKKYNNHFGLKCGSGKKGVWGVWDGTSVNLGTKEEYTVGTLTSIKANFRVFKDLDNGIHGYYEFVSTKRYANLKDAPNYMIYAQCLKDDGYATSSTYVNTLINTVKKYGLDKYDNYNYAPSVEPNKAVVEVAIPTVKKGSRGVNVELLQSNLNSLGATLVKDGIAGKKTDAAIREFQAKNNIVVDGIYGKNSYAKMCELLNK